MELRLIMTGTLLALGIFFIIVASIGIIRFPDFFSRIHPAGKSDTLGQLLVLLGLIAYEGFTLVSIKLLIIITFILIANPTATQAMAKAAFMAGLKIGTFKSLQDISKKWRADNKFFPNIRSKERLKLLKGWSLAVKKTLIE